MAALATSAARPREQQRTDSRGADDGTPGSPGWRPAARAALPVWLLSRIGLVLLTVSALWVVAPPGDRSAGVWYRGWLHWDTQWYAAIAQHGYGPDPALLGLDHGRAAFFPLFPLLIRGLHGVGLPFLAGGLLLSSAAAAVALVLLWRLVADESGAEVAGHAIRYLVLAPYAVFLFAAYTESLFLAVSLGAWLCARRAAWVPAWALAALAVLTRATGFALCAGLLVAYVLHVVSGRSSARAKLLALVRPATLLPALPALAYGAFLVVLHGQTGRWDAFFDAEKVFSRGLSTPADALRKTETVIRVDPHPAVVFEFRVEIVVVVIALVTAVALFAQRRWAEATYAGAAATMIVFGGVYNSGVRLLLVLFPLTALLARAAVRRRWLDQCLILVGAPLSALMAVGFVRGQWVG